MGLSTHCLAHSNITFFGGSGQPRFPRLIQWAFPCHLVPGVHTDVPPTAQRSRFCGHLRTIAVPSPTSFVGRTCGPVRCLLLSALAGDKAAGAVSTPFGLAPSI